MEFNNNFDSNLVKILEKIICNSYLMKKLEYAEDIEGIYNICKKLGYNQNIYNFEKQIMKIINYVQKISDKDLEKVSGGKNNLQKTCAILLTAVNISFPLTNAIDDSNNYVSVKKQKDTKISNLNKNKFKEKFDVFLSKTNDYVRHGFKQISEYAENNPKTTVGISLATAVSVSTVAYIANKISLCIENFRDITETSEQKVSLLFSELCDIFNNIKISPERYYEKFESDGILRIIPSNGYIFSFIVHAKNAGFNISPDVFKFSVGQSLSTIEIMNRLKSSTTDKYLLRAIDNLLDKNAENIRIYSKVIIDRITTIIKEKKKRRQREEQERLKHEKERRQREEQERLKHEKERRQREEQERLKHEKERKNKEQQPQEKLHKYLEKENSFKNTFCKELFTVIIRLSESQNTKPQDMTVSIENLLNSMPKQDEEKNEFKYQNFANHLYDKFKVNLSKNINLDDLKTILDQNAIYQVAKEEDDFLQELLILGHICNKLFNDGTKEHFTYDKCNGFATFALSLLPKYNTDYRKNWDTCLEKAQSKVNELIK